MDTEELYADDLYKLLDKKFTRIRRMDVKYLRAEPIDDTEFPFTQTADNQIIYSCGKEASPRQISSQLIPEYLRLGVNTYANARPRLQQNGDRICSISFYRAPWHRLFVYRAQRLFSQKKA